MRKTLLFVAALLGSSLAAVGQKLPACPDPKIAGSHQTWTQQVERLPLPQQVAAIRQRMLCDTAYESNFSPAVCRGLLGTLDGRSASVTVQATSLPADTRPIGAPLLYVVDNVPQRLATSAAVLGFWRQEPNHPIRQVTLLSGPAAAAIYGARGANGVVLLSSEEPRRR